jgi:hypothetical protein
VYETKLEKEKVLEREKILLKEYDTACSIVYGVKILKILYTTMKVFDRIE